MTQNQSCLRFTIERHVSWLEFSRPPVNAFTREMVDETHDAVAAALSDPAVRVLVLASAVPRYFSAGADLHVFKGIGQDGMRRHGPRRCHDIVRLLRGSPKPLLAAINGTAVGGGLEITLHCDLRFAATDARLGQPEINIGFILPIATAQALARLIGRPGAIRYLYDGRLVPAAEALGWGGRRAARGSGIAGARSGLWRTGGEVAGGARRHPAHRDLGGGMPSRTA